MNAPRLAQCLVLGSLSKRKQWHSEPGEGSGGAPAEEVKAQPAYGRMRVSGGEDGPWRPPLPPQPPRAPNLGVHVGQAVPAELVEEPLALEVVHDHGHELRVSGTCTGPRAARRTRANPGARRRRRRLRLRRGRRRRRRRRLRLRVSGHGGLGQGRRRPGRAGAPGRRRLHRSRRLREANGMLLRNQRIQSNPGSEREPGEEWGERR